MATPNSIKITEVTQVSPSSNSPKSATEASLPLTLFDLFWIKFHPVERLFFYQNTNSTPTFFYSTILPKLKRSLSLTLLHFLPLAGRLTWPSHAPKPFILYTPNDGVPLTVAESNADFNHLSSNEILEAVELSPCVPNLPISDDIASTISLQITLFPNFGFCIGITAHHAILDGKSATMFIKAWANICKQDKENPSLLSEHTPFFDRTVVKDPNGLDMVYLNGYLATEAKFQPDSNPRTLNLWPSGANIEELVRATFELTREDIKNLRKRVVSMLNKVDEEEKKASKSIHLSSFVLALGYLLVCLVKAKEGAESTRKVRFGFAADYRTRLEPPVPVNYFGNCVGVYDIVELEARSITEENGMAILAEKISDVIRGMENGVLEGAEEKFAKLMMSTGQGALMIGVAGSPRFEVYGADFGWGRPKKVDIVSIDRTGSISLAESRDGSGGIEAGLVMKKHEMEAFSSLIVDGLKA